MSLSQKDKNELFQKGLLQVAQQVHISVMGDEQILDGKEQIKYVDYLRYRLNLWVKYKNSEFDLRVRDLITTVIDEYDDWDVTFSKLSDYGDLMTISEFLEGVGSSCFIDYDGSGYLATATQKSNVHIRPSTINKVLQDHPEYRNTWATHVIWFNR